MANLLEREFKKRETALEAACAAANHDRALEKEVADWQAFEDRWDG